MDLSPCCSVTVALPLQVVGLLVGALQPEEIKKDAEGAAALRHAQARARPSGSDAVGRGAALIRPVVSFLGDSCGSSFRRLATAATSCELHVPEPQGSLEALARPVCSCGYM